MFDCVLNKPLNIVVKFKVKGYLMEIQKIDQPEN